MIAFFLAGFLQHVYVLTVELLLEGGDDSIERMLSVQDLLLHDQHSLVEAGGRVQDQLACFLGRVLNLREVELSLLSQGQVNVLYLQ